MRFLKSLFAAFAFTAFMGAAVATPALAAKPEIYAKRENVALSGYDAVSYFKGEAPSKGQAQFQTSYKGATFQFANAENLAAFKAAPAQYAPQYGGYCAWAAAQGKTAPSDPLLYKVVNGKLYLNYNKSIQTKWEKDIPGFIAKADKNWPSILE